MVVPAAPALAAPLVDDEVVPELAAGVAVATGDGVLPTNGDAGRTPAPPSLRRAPRPLTGSSLVLGQGDDAEAELLEKVLDEALQTEAGFADAPDLADPADPASD